jgi:hypothetical protein
MILIVKGQCPKQPTNPVSLILTILKGGYSREKLDFLMAIGEGLLNISGSTGS